VRHRQIFRRLKANVWRLVVVVVVCRPPSVVDCTENVVSRLVTRLVVVVVVCRPPSVVDCTENVVSRLATRLVVVVVVVVCL